MPGLSADSALAFGRFRLQLRPLVLSIGRERLELAPKALQILAVLIQRAGQVVSKDDLLEIVWPDSVVEEGNLAVHISGLRKCLLRNGGGSYIETVTKVGYVFTASVRFIEDARDLPDASAPVHRIATHYLKQRTLIGWRAAMRILKKKLGESPCDSRAQVLLAEAHYLAFELGVTPIDLATDQALALLDTAAEISPDDAQNWLVRAKFKESSGWRWDEAEADYSYALELDPGCAAAHGLLGRHLCRRGAFSRSNEHFDRALQLDPLCPEIRKFHADSLWLAGRFEETIRAAQDGLLLHPNCWFLQLPYARAQLALSNYSKALKYHRRAMLQNPGQRLTILGEMAYAHATAGMTDRAVRLLKRLREAMTGPCYVSPIAVSRVFLALGDEHRAVEAVEQACALRDMFVPWIKLDPRLDRLRPNTRFRDLVSAVAL